MSAFTYPNLRRLVDGYQDSAGGSVRGCSHAIERPVSSYLPSGDPWPHSALGSAEALVGAGVLRCWTQQPELERFERVVGEWLVLAGRRLLTRRIPLNERCWCWWEAGLDDEGRLAFEEVLSQGVVACSGVALEGRPRNLAGERGWR